MNTKLTLSSLILVCFFVFSTTLQAQTLSFKVIRSDAFKAVDHVKIKSSSHGVFYSDANGHFQLSYQNHDTLTLTKDGFHTIHYVIEAKNFDTTHTISLTMTALSAEELQHAPASDISSLQKFDYHFVHDNPSSDSYLKIHAMETLPENKARTGYQKEFKIGTVPLNHTIIERKADSKSEYKLK
ncbi:MAG: hypothetical protein K0R51_1885 [Cytophagaceae bacterium]|jgi:hypothetical protein|nr:hypothetical protein [Cytophagaceae bacterium]